MHDEPSRSTDSAWTTDHQDRQVEQSVLLTVIDLHPAHVTVSELVRRLTRSPRAFIERDGVERAVTELAGKGLMHKHDFRNRPDAFVTPTQAALWAHELLLDEADEAT
jgi:hypothetical protein